MPVKIVILIVMLLVVLSWSAKGQAEVSDVNKRLEEALAKPWQELIVVLMVDQGCVAPEHRGFVVTRSGNGFEIANWGKKDLNVTKGRVSPISEAEVKQMQQSLLLHYQTACAADDIRERLAKIESKEERLREMGKIFARDGVPTGGFEQIGMEISITGKEFGRVFKDAFAKGDYQEFSSWLDTVRKD